LLKSINPVPDVIVQESTYTDEVLQKIGSEVQHCSAKQVAQSAESIGLYNLILTYFSARYQNGKTKLPCIDNIANEAKHYYSSNLFLANDFEVYHLNKL
jgi:ribonuclease Z